MRIAINGNRHQEKHLEAIRTLTDTLVRRGDDVVMSERFLDYLTIHLGDRFRMGLDYTPLSLQPKADLALSIGGDGAFLKTARWVGDAEIPVAGINTGHLGYLSAFTFDDPEKIYNNLLEGDFRVEKRSMLHVKIEVPATEDCRQKPFTKELTALNEIALTRGDIASMLRIAATINGRSSLNYMGDGLIISTPTGSTAYNLSVGGPILDPELAGWVLSPIAAHSLSMRPLVVKDSSRIELRVDARGEGFHLAADGKPVTLPLNAVLTVTRAPYGVNVVQQTEHTFTDTLREKLGLGNTLV